MTLLLPAPPAFGYFVTNEDSPASGGVYGSSVPAPGSTNTKSGWVAIHSTISYDLFLHTFTISQVGTTGASTRLLFDLGIGPDSSNVTVIAENLNGSNAAAYTQGGSLYNMVPLYVPAGTQLWARSQSSVASAPCRIHAASWGAPDHPESFPKISYIEALGENTGTTSGTAITAGASGTLGTATSLGSFTNDVCGVMFSIGSDDASLAAVAYVGALTTDATATVQELGKCCRHMNLSTTEQVRENHSVIWCDIPAGQTVAGRISCTGTSDSTMWGIAYGLVRG